MIFIYCSDLHVHIHIKNNSASIRVNRFLKTTFHYLTRQILKNTMCLHLENLNYFINLVCVYIKLTVL